HHRIALSSTPTLLRSTLFPYTTLFRSSAGIHIYADADFPGQYDAYSHANTNWVSRMSYLFGLNVANAFPGYAFGITNIDYVGTVDRKSTRLNSSHLGISYAVFCLKKKK